MKTLCLLFTVLTLLTRSASADLTVWDYDLTNPPDGWLFDPLWEFTSEGVLLDQYVSSPWTTKDGEIQSPEVTVPANCDSVVMHVEQDLYMFVSGMGAGYTCAEVSYKLNGGVWTDFYSASLFEQTTDPIHYSIPASAGDLLQLKVYGGAWCGSEMYPGIASIDWLLYDVTLTFYGEALSLQPHTWGAVKNSFN